jgi:hypothetical protein
MRVFKHAWKMRVCVQIYVCVQALVRASLRAYKRENHSAGVQALLRLCLCACIEVLVSA